MSGSLLAKWAMRPRETEVGPEVSQCVGEMQLHWFSHEARNPDFYTKSPSWLKYFETIGAVCAGLASGSEPVTLIFKWTSFSHKECPTGNP